VFGGLVGWGAVDWVGRSRARLWAALNDVLRWASLRTQERTSPQLGLFGGGDGASGLAPPALPDVPAWSAQEELQRERETLGFFITGHPLDRYENDLRRFTNVTVGTLRSRGPQLPT